MEKLNKNFTEETKKDIFSKLSEESRQVFSIRDLELQLEKLLDYLWDLYKEDVALVKESIIDAVNAGQEPYPISESSILIEDLFSNIYDNFEEIFNIENSLGEKIFDNVFLETIEDLEEDSLWLLDFFYDYIGFSNIEDVLEKAQEELEEEFKKL